VNAIAIVVAAVAVIVADAPSSTTAPAAVRPLTLGDVWNSVEAHHPTIAVAAAEAAAARGEQLAQDGAFDPVVKAKTVGDVGYYPGIIADVGVDVPTTLWGTTLSGGWRGGYGDFPAYDGKLKTNDGGELRVGLLVPLLRDGAIDRRRAGVERLSLEQRVQDEAVRAARLELRRAAGLAYWEWVAAGARVDVARRALALAQTRDAQLAERARVGDVAAFEHRDNERIVAQRRARLASTERGLEKAALDLALFLRDDDGAPVVVDVARLPSLTTPAPARDDRVALVDDALRLRPDVARLRIVDEQLGVDARLADNQLLPGLSLSAGVSQDLGDSSSTPSSPTAWSAAGKTRAVPEAEVGVTFDLPVPVRQARGRVAVVQAQRTRVAAQARLLRDRVVVEVDDARSAARAAAARIAAAADEVAAAAAVEDAERVRFDAGDATMLMVNLRETATVDARLATVDAALDARRAEVALLAATAHLLDDDARP
jgi:outer membrane protein TolC